MATSKKHLAGVSAFFGASLGSVLVTTFPFGFFLKHLGTDGYIGIALFGLVVPLGLILVANVSEQAKKIVLFSCTVLAVFGSYYTMLAAPNYLFPEFQLDVAGTYMFFLALGMQFTIFMIAAAELGRLAREDGKGWYLGAGAALAGGLAAASLLTGPQGWLYPVMIVNYILPSGMLLYFLFVPVASEARAPQLPGTIAPLHVKDTTRGLKLALFTILACLSIIVSIGIQGLALPRPDFFSVGWSFWLCAGAGGFIAAMVARFTLLPHLAEPASPAKKHRLQASWILVTLIQFGLIASAASMEFFVDGFHASIASHVVNGLVLGFSIVMLLAVWISQHPPRSLYAFLMFVAFFIAFSAAVGSYVKALDVDLASFLSYGEYAIYVIAALALGTGVLVAAQAITLVKSKRA